LEAFARPSHEGVGPVFKAVIIVPATSSAKTLADLKGTVIAFGDRASTPGTWAPRYQLLEAGLAAGRDYTLRGVGSHDNVTRTVAGGLVAAGDRGGHARRHAKGALISSHAKSGILQQKWRL
jgi:phosphonate transport system substrate-binding protein